MFRNDKFVVTDERFLQPSYRISPFTTNDIKKNIDIIKKFNYKNELKDYLKTEDFIITSSGRQALNEALSFYNLSPNDIVTIFTTSDNFYISSCVTKEIEKYCKWSRKIEDNTKIIFVNHEFGFPYEELKKLKNYNLPIIEDCAHSFCSQNSECSVGAIGDYVIYSLPKFFPIQFGGLLKSNNSKLDKSKILHESEEKYILSVTSYYLQNLESIVDTRRKNYSYIEDKFSKINLTSIFDMKDYHCPGTYLFKNDSIDLENLKKFMQYHGVESSVFYGENAFFIPAHQSLEEADLDYIFELYMSFVEEVR